MDALAITSIPLPHLKLMVAQDYAHSILDPRRPLAIPLRVYYDGEGRRPLFTNVSWVSLAEVQPWALTVLNQGTAPRSPLQRRYDGGVSAAGGLECLVELEVGAMRLCKDIYTVLKVAAIYDAVHRPVSQHVLWLDLDTWFQRALDSHFWGWLCAFDVATIRRKGYYPDTGITYYQSSSRTQLLLQDARDTYTTSSNFHVSGPRPRGCNDIQVLGFLLEQPRHQGLRVGNFAIGCRPSARVRAPRWVRDAMPYKAKPRLHFCPNEVCSK